MADRKMLILSFSLILWANLSPSIATNVVPVLIWGNKNIEKASPLPAGHSLSTDQFASDVLSKVDQHDVLLFLQNHLSLDDLTQAVNAYSPSSDGGVLHKLKSLMAKHSSAHLPRVISPQAALDAWTQRFSGKVHHLKAPYNMKEVPLSGSQRNMVVVHLPQDDIKQSDDVIHSVSREMESLGRDYNALYTGASSSKTRRQPMYTGRHLLQTNTPYATSYDHFYNISSCIFFYADNITFTVNSEQNNTYSLNTANSSQSGCSPPTLVLDFPRDGSLSHLKLTVEFTNSSTGYWYANTWTVSYDAGGISKTDAVLKSGDNIYGPMKHSYHCTDPKIVEKANGTGKDEARFYFKNLQLQGFEIAKDKFGRASDCVGFFTIPIWSGLISTLVLIAILAFGIQMLASINTMDRFDDPKGKTISVNISE